VFVGDEELVIGYLQDFLAILLSMNWSLETNSPQQ